MPTARPRPLRPSYFCLPLPSGAELARLEAKLTSDLWALHAALPHELREQVCLREKKTREQIFSHATAHASLSSRRAA